MVHKDGDFLNIFIFPKDRDCLHNFMFYKSRDFLQTLGFLTDRDLLQTFIFHKERNYLYVFMFHKERNFFAHMRSYHRLNTKPCILAKLAGYDGSNNNITVCTVRTPSFMTS